MQGLILALLTCMDRRLEWQLYFTEHYNYVVTEHYNDVHYTEHCVQLACYNDVS